MQDAMDTKVRRLGLLAAVLLTMLAASAVAASGASAACSPRVCVDVVSNPTTVSPSVAPFFNFVSYEVSVTNQASSTATHVTLSDALTELGTLVSATTTQGTCTSTSASAACAFGSVRSGGRVTVTILVQAPEVEGQVTSKATVSFDEGDNDNPPGNGKQDTVTASASTPVAAIDGAAVSLVPSNTEVRLDTDPTGADVATPENQNIGKARVPASNHPPITAALNEESGPFTCPKKVLCRAGDWVRAQIPGTFDPALEFELHWSKTLALPKQSTKNLAVLHTDCLVTCPVTVISIRCSSSNPLPKELPCLSNVAETASEFRATLHSKKNGYMR
jgi:uncharacterized repeat protein (TIGR01451 family)